MTGKDLSVCAGISQGHISELENGRKNLTEQIAEKIAVGCGMTIDELYREFDERTEAWKPPVFAGIGASVLRDDEAVYRVSKPNDEFRELSVSLVKKMPITEAWDLVRQFTVLAQEGDESAARCAKALLDILSEKSQS